MTGSAPSTLKSRPDYRMSRASIKPLQELFLVARGLISLKDYTKFNCVGGWIMIAKLTVMPSILCYRLGHWLVKNGILELGIGTAGYILVKLTLLKLQVTLIPLPVEVSCPLISEETSFPLLENSMLTSSGADVLKEDAPSQDPPQPPPTLTDPQLRSNLSMGNKCTLWPSWKSLIHQNNCKSLLIYNGRNLGNMCRRGFYGC